jgi:hypothetical protein
MSGQSKARPAASSFERIMVFTHAHAGHLASFVACLGWIVLCLLGPRAGRTAGAMSGKNCEAHGYTLLAGSIGSHVAAPVLTPNLKCDSERDFVPTVLS